MVRRAPLKRPPWTVAAYLFGTGGLIALSFAPSAFEVHMAPLGMIVEGVLLLGLCLGSRICRWVLIFFGIWVGIGSFFLQSGSLDMTSLLWTGLLLAITALLFTPSMRRWTGGHRPEVEAPRVG